MKTLFAFLVLLWSGVTWGQSYHKLINEHLYWDVPVADMGYICQGYGDHGPYRYKFSGDTGINEKTYAKIYFGEFISLLTPPSPNCPPFVIDTIFTLLPDVFIREDTGRKRFGGIPLQMYLKKFYYLTFLSVREIQFNIRTLVR